MLESHNSITALHVAANTGNLEGLRYFISVKCGQVSGIRSAD